jgi:hypothetical protein
MNDNTASESDALAWLQDGPARAPAHVIDAALQRIDTVAQDGTNWSRLGRRSWLTAAVIASLGVAAVSVATLMGGVRLPAVGPGATGSALPSAARSEPLPTTGIVVLPDPSYVSFNGTSAEWLQRIAGCLRDKGWDATIEWDGGMHASVGPDRQAAFEADKLACWDVFGGPPPYVPPTDAQIRAIYDYWAHDLRDCLIGMGYAIGEPPSKQEFLRTYPRTEGVVESGPWSPYSELPENLGPHSWREVNETCPQAPPA